ncbi:MAG: hypothetical protein WA485_05390 [Candidatus Sulfotelmatobacter sp.]
MENSTVYFLLLKQAKVPAEMHLYAQGGHGYGLPRTELPDSVAATGREVAEKRFTYWGQSLNPGFGLPASGL